MACDHCCTRLTEFRRRAVCVCVAVVGVLLVGFVFGVLVRPPPSNSDTQALRHMTREADIDIRAKLLAEINVKNIREHLRELTRKPHLAGTEASHQMARHIKRLWEEQGLTGVKMIPYTVMLSYPDKDNPNRIVMRDGEGEIVHTSQLKEKILRPEQNHPDVVPPFNAFSASGTPQGQLVYVNYARMEDFLWLKDNKHIDFTDKICIARYGKIFRGDKTKHAELFGASGLILYSDPQDYSAGGAQAAYPDSWWLPGSGVQRGTVNEVDPLTPGYPGIESAYFDPDGESNLPTIPVHPIGYDDARIFLEQLGGEEAPEQWRGALPITYRLGPGFHNVTWSIQMFISTHNENRTTYNVFGYIEGDIEPDRYVLVGNHYDAWVFGAVDPSSGTASMLELSRSIGKLVREGWRPRRTIVFCAWGAEEEGIIGSREWVENYGHIIGNRAVAYLNVDIAMQGNYTFRGRALPMLFQALYDATKQVPNPNPYEVLQGRTTVYDTWVIGMPQEDANGKTTGKPRIPLLGSGSDFAPFIKKVGVTCADLRYHFDEKLGISSYPLYHSVYETFHLVDKIMDPTFVYHKATTQVWGELTRHLADAYILPFDLMSFATAIERYAEGIQKSHGSLMKDHGLAKRLEYMKMAVVKFRLSTKQFQKRVESVDKQNPVVVRQLNDQMMQLERAFIDPLGLPGRPLTRNVLFAPSQQNSYAGSSFPGLSDALFEISRDPAQQTRWREVEKQLAIITFFIEAAAASLQEPTDF